MPIQRGFKKDDILECNLFGPASLAEVLERQIFVLFNLASLLTMKIRPFIAMQVNLILFDLLKDMLMYGLLQETPGH